MGLFSFGSKEKFNIIDGLYTSDYVPGKDILKSYGLIYYTKTRITGDITEEIDNILQNLLNIAKEKGANAVLNVRLVTGSYQAQGSGWIVTYVIAYGEAVILK